jgi:hypothetical protein
VVYVGKMPALQATEDNARRRYEEAGRRSDVPALRVAATELTRAAKAATDYALGQVEPYSDAPK